MKKGFFFFCLLVFLQALPAAALELGSIQYPPAVSPGENAAIELDVSHHPNYKVTVTLRYTMIGANGTAAAFDGWEKTKADLYFTAFL